MNYWPEAGGWFSMNNTTIVTVLALLATASSPGLNMKGCQWKVLTANANRGWMNTVLQVGVLQDRKWDLIWPQFEWSLVEIWMFNRNVSKHFIKLQVWMKCCSFSLRRASDWLNAKWIFSMFLFNKSNTKFTHAASKLHHINHMWHHVNLTGHVWKYSTDLETKCFTFI